MESELYIIYTRTNMYERELYKKNVRVRTRNLFVVYFVYF